MFLPAEGVGTEYQSHKQTLPSSEIDGTMQLWSIPEYTHLMRSDPTYGPVWRSAWQELPDGKNQNFIFKSALIMLINLKSIFYLIEFFAHDQFKYHRK